MQSGKPAEIGSPAYELSKELGWDMSDQANMGRPIYFDLKQYCITIEQLIMSDETKTALYLLDNPPGWYRDNYPEELTTIRRHLYRALDTIKDYTDEPGQMKDNAETIREWIDGRFCFPRGPITLAIVKRLNDQGLIPTIYDFGPGNFWLPVGLLKHGAKFLYYPIEIHSKALDHAINGIPEFKTLMEESKNQTPTGPVIFTCFETIEHLWDETEIPRNFERWAQVDPDYVLLSTPYCQLSNGYRSENWFDARLGHVRTLTKSELVEFAQKSWPAFKEWAHFLSDMQVLFGQSEQAMAKNGKIGGWSYQHGTN